METELYRVLRSAEVQKLLGCKRSKVAALWKSQELKSVKVGRNRGSTLAQVLDYLKSRES